MRDEKSQTLDPAGTLLRVDGLTKRFSSVVANDSVSLDISKGEVHCLLGENGAGKSTLAECLCGFYRPDAGRLEWLGHPVKLSSPRDAVKLGIGIVHQHFALVPPLSVLENIVVGLPSLKTIPDMVQAERKVASLCATYGIDLDLQSKVRQLSIGKQQWVEILKALYSGVRLLILDEPTAVLTPQEADCLLTIMRRLAKDGISILFITHKLSEVMRVADRISVMRRGKYVATTDAANATPHRLVSMMVGKDIPAHNPRERAASRTPLLEVHQLTARSDRDHRALQNMSFTLHSHEILAVAGVSGNGQSELLEVLIGVRKVDAGRIVLAGTDITGRSPHFIQQNGLSHIPEDRIADGLVMDLSVAENLILGRHNERVFLRGPVFDRGAIEEFANKCVAGFDIRTSSVKQPARTLSGGNLQKLILARELSQNPRCIVASQPTRGLDVGATYDVHSKLLQHKSAGAGILLISEDLDEILELADRIAVIYKGEIMSIVESEKASPDRLGMLMTGMQEVAC